MSPPTSRATVETQRLAQPIESRPPSSVEGSRLPDRAQSTGTLRRLHEAALVGFGERGYHGVSIRELAEAAGVRVSSVYSHVAAKEDILLALVLIGHEEHNARLREALDQAGSDPVRQMRDLVAAHVEMHARYPLLTSVCNKELHALSAENAERVKIVRADSERAFLDVIERGMATGVFRCEDPWLSVAAIAGMGIRVAEWYDPHLRSVDEVAAAYADFAIKLLAF